MSRRFLFIALIGLALAASITPAQRLAAALPADEQAFFDKHLSDLIKVEPTRVTDAAVVKAFGVPIYKVNLVIQMGDSSENQDLVAARSGDKLVVLARPSGDGDCPDMLKMLNPAFTLSTDDDAKGLQTALDTLYPVNMDNDKKVVAFKHSGHDWTFVRGTFFDKQMGFVFTTDDKGKVTAIKYVLKLP